MSGKSLSTGGKYQVLTKQVTRSNWVAYWADKDGLPVTEYAEALTEEGAKRLLKCRESGLTVEALSKFIDDHYDLNERGELRCGVRYFSARSAEDGVDVSEIAKLHRGGGHKHAAGFKLEEGQGLTQDGN